MKRAVTISFIAVLLSSLAVAQGNPPDQPPTVTIRKQTNLVLVPVVVTDAHGKPVLDLTQQDFQVLQDKQPQQIAIFEKPEPEHAAERGHSMVVIVFDNLNSAYVNQIYARDEAIRFLDHHVGPLPPTAIVALNGTGLLLVQQFTQDPEVLRKAIKAAKGQQTLFSSVLTENTPERMNAARALQNLQIQGMMAGQPLGPGNMQVAERLAKVMARVQDARDEQQASFEGYALNYSADLTLRAMLTLGESLSGLPGRKSILWTAQVFPFSAAEARQWSGAGNRRGNRFTPASNTVYKNPLFLRTMEVLTNANAAVYPIDPAGVGEIWSSQGLQEVANLTGGVAYFNRNDVDRIYGRAIDDGGNTYLLGYYFDPKAGKEGWHDLKVNVSGHGKVQARSRTGFLNTTPYDPRSAAVDIASALISPFDFTNIPVQVDSVTHPAGHKTGVVFQVEVPAASLAIDESPSPHLSLRMVALAVSEDGKRHFMTGKNFEHALSADDISKLGSSRLTCPGELDIPEGKYMLRIVVRDQVSGRVASATGPVTVEALAP